MKKIFFLAVTFFCVSILFAQTKSKTTRAERKEKKNERIAKAIKLEEEGVIVSKKHFITGAKLTSDGYGIFLEKGITKSVKNSILFQLDIAERKHPKELKETNGNSGPFVYGKINFFYPVKLGVQYQQLLGNKGNKNGLCITANVGGGISLGLQRPYKLLYDSSGVQYYEGLVEKKDTTKFLQGSIYKTSGGPSFGTGFKNMSIIPGAYVKAALRFDYGKYNEQVSAIEVGITAEFYAKKIPQMIFNKENNFFFSAYFAIMVGKRK
jgi:hypothetical protein